MVRKNHSADKPDSTFFAGWGILVPLVLSWSSAVAALYLLIRPPAGLTPIQGQTAALPIFTVGQWATARLPEQLTALVFFLLAMLLGVAPADVVFSGFQSSALWMVFAGLVIALAAKTTGLSERLARGIALRLDRHYASLIGGILGVGVLLGFLMPSSMGRVVLLMPIAVALAQSLGFEPGSNGRTGVILAAAFGTFLPSFTILPANVPNMVLLGAAESLYHVTPLYGEYLLLHFPVLGLLKSLLILGLILWRYPDRPRPPSHNPESGPLSPNEWKMAGILALSIGFWMTDFIHHVSPAWIALAAAVLLLLPRLGLVSNRQFSTEINYSPLLFVAGVIGLGTLISYSGLGTRLAGYLTAVLPLAPGNHALNFLSLALVSMVTGLIATMPGVPAVLTPLSEHIAQAAGLPVKTVLMTQVLGFSTPLFLYQAPPLVIAMQIAGERFRPAMLLCLQLALLSLVLLMPLDYLWWHWLGWI